MLRWSLVVAAGLAVLLILWRITGRTLALAQEVTPVPYTISTESPFAVALVRSATPLPTATFTAAPTGLPAIIATPTTLPSPTAPATVALPTTDPECARYHTNLDLLAPVVGRDVELDRNFVPPDLETPQLAFRNAYVVPVTLRRLALQPLYEMLNASNDAGMQIMVVSGYRSYTEQKVAYDKWTQLYPDRANGISALPGHSEHQLGLAIDFSTPYMEGLYQNLFHTNFFYTVEGQWLNENAAGFGFTLSFPSWGVEQTGFDWEPWHFRYVGVDLAQDLSDRRITLTDYIRECSTR